MKATIHFFCGIVIIFLAACSTEESIPVRQLPQQPTQENVFADMLLQSLKQQDDIWNYTQRQTVDKNLLFDYTVLSVSQDFGLHYSVPYQTPDGTVRGCLI